VVFMGDWKIVGDAMVEDEDEE